MRRSATAPVRRSTLRSITSAAQCGRRLARAHDHGGAAAVLLERFDRTRQRDQARRPRGGRCSRRRRSECPRRGSRPCARAHRHRRRATAGPRSVSLPARAMRQPAVGAANREARPSAAIRTSGCGVRTAHRLAIDEQRHAGEPQRRFEQAQQHERRRCRAATARCRTPPCGRPRPAGSRPRARSRSSSRCPSPSATRRSRRSRTASATTPRMPIGMIQTDTTGIASRLAITP